MDAEADYSSVMGEMSFTFPPDLENWIELRVAEGRYADAADYMRDLVRRDQEGFLPECGSDGAETPEYIAWIRERVAEGLASGWVNAEPEDVIEEIIAERRARRG